MEKLNLEEVSHYVEHNIGTFHQKRTAGLTDLKLNKVLSKKNPYLFKAKYILTSQDIIKSLTDAFISSQEETIFGDWLEGLAIFINSKVFKGRKSGIPGIDLEFDQDTIRYIVTIKSGPNWGNSSQVAKLKADFRTAKKTLRTSNSNLNIIAVNGCCYGRDNNPEREIILNTADKNFGNLFLETRIYISKLLNHWAIKQKKEMMNLQLLIPK